MKTDVKRESRRAGDRGSLDSTEVGMCGRRPLRKRLEPARSAGHCLGLELTPTLEYWQYRLSKLTVPPKLVAWASVGPQRCIVTWCEG